MRFYNGVLDIGPRTIVDQRKREAEREERILRWSRERFGQVNTYVVEVVGHGLVKIGKTKNLYSRVASIQTGCPYLVQLIAILFGDVEDGLHREFASSRVRGEWFVLDERLENAISAMDRIPTEFEVAQSRGDEIHRHSWKANRR